MNGEEDWLHAHPWPWAGKDLGEAEMVSEKAKGRVVRNAAGGSVRGHIAPHGSFSFL